MNFYEKISVISQLVSALLFAGIMVWIWIKMIAPAIKAAQEAENKHIAGIELRLEESRRALALLNEEIEGAGRDAEAIRKRAVELAAFEREEALKDARESGERTLHNAQGELPRALASAREKLRTRILDRALEIARTRAIDRVDAGMDAKLIAGFVAGVEKGGSNG